MEKTLIWISGATQGIGLGLARQVPWPDAKIINISRRAHPDYETVRADLADASSWAAIAGDFKRRLSGFRGRAIFIHNAYVSLSGNVGEADAQALQAAAIANCAAPLVLADAFLRCRRPDFEAGLVLLSSDAAAFAYPGLAPYCAAKVAIEHWAEVARRELAGQPGAWVAAVRPGTVRTPPVEAMAAKSPAEYPGVERMRAKLAARGVSIDEAGRRIWQALPPPPGVSTISFGERPDGERGFGGSQVLMLGGGGGRSAQTG